MYTLVKVSLINESDNPDPKYETEGSAGMDLRAYLPEGQVKIFPRKRAIIDTGIRVVIPSGHEGQVRSRSGLAAKHGIMVLNSPGTIDSDYRGRIKVILLNTSDTVFEVNSGDRIAQLVFAQHSTAVIHIVESFDDIHSTERGEGGFGSTGVH
uniref:dUTP diphosphatase n=1 Tax=viral metagenome TaxID=1070528 RepID=A0A6C0CK84_9ZZZZ